VLAIKNWSSSKENPVKELREPEIDFEQGWGALMGHAKVS